MSVVYAERSSGRRSHGRGAALFAAFAMLCGFVGAALAQDAPAMDAAVHDPLVPWSAPSELTLLADQPSVSVPVAGMGSEEGGNFGGVNLSLNVNYMTDDMYRGVNYGEVATHKKSLNMQCSGELSFDLGRFPHPFVGVFVDVDDSDPISRFKEIRPYFGLEWKMRPLTFAIGDTSYIYPEREQFNTSEAWVKMTLDDSYLTGTDQPLLSPYIMAAYDYDINNGWYFEAGVRHDWVIEDTGLTISAVADVGYISGIQTVFVFTEPRDNGFQHYDIGILGSYSLNTLFDFPRRFGEWSLNGYVYYTGKFQNDILADSQVWGGFGIGFKY